MRLPFRRFSIGIGLALSAAVAVVGTSRSADELQVVTPADLKRAAASAPPAVSSLYRFIATPADKIALTAGKEIWIVPTARFLGSPPVFAGEINVTVVLGDDAGNKRKLASADIASVTPFEQLAVEKVSAFLGGAAEKDLPKLSRLRAAENAIQALAWFHEGTRARPANDAGPWNKLHYQLLQALRDNRLSQLTLLAETAKKEGHWRHALDLADRLARSYAADSSIGHELRLFWAGYGMHLVGKEDYKHARRVLTRIEQTYLHDPEAKLLRASLLQKAVELAKEAELLPDAEADAKLSTALELWPHLPGARDALLKRRKQYRILNVGVPRLPEMLSPAAACTDAEKQAVELLFESLVRPSHRMELGQRFEPQLAAGLPAPHPLHRRFRLRADACWSNGERVTSADIRQTVQLAHAGQPAWRDLVEVPRVEQESLDIDFRMQQGYLDPLALLSFKILPRRYQDKTLLRAADPDFARLPMGSGPCVYRGQKTENGRPFAVFTANPNYVRGTNSPGPLIREIRFFASANAKEVDPALLRSALLLDIPTEQLRLLKKLGVGNVRTLAQNRVYFLAVNHRVKPLAQLELRRALAHAIDRDKILDNCFRGGYSELGLLEALGPALAVPFLPLREGHPEFHRALNGPYPADCWASCPPPRVPAVLHDPALAKTMFRTASKMGPLKLTLKYPDDEPSLARACREIADHVQRLAALSGSKVQFQLIPLPPHALKEAIDKHDYELAYCHHDFPTEDYWLWPLFDPHPDALAAGGSNYLGYDNDSKLQAMFHSVRSYRHFPTVRDLTHAIHAHLNLQMPVIPLWQLHRHIAVPPGLDTGHLEPLRLFSDVAQWKYR